MVKIFFVWCLGGGFGGSSGVIIFSLPVEEEGVVSPEGLVSVDGLALSEEWSYGLVLEVWSYGLVLSAEWSYGFEFSGEWSYGLVLSEGLFSFPSPCKPPLSSIVVGTVGIVGISIWSIGVVCYGVY